MNTDAQALSSHSALNKVQIGTELTRGLGCGGNPELGRRAAEESEDALRKMVQVGGLEFCCPQGGVDLVCSLNPLVRSGIQSTCAHDCNP